MHPTPTPSVSGKILVIDDNPVIQRTLRLELQTQGYTVLVSGEITEALQIVRKEKPSAILLDINFPPNPSVSGVYDGFWALDWLGRIQESKDIPVIIISSDDPATAGSRAMAAGAAAYLQKPICKNKLAATLTGLQVQ